MRRRQVLVDRVHFCLKEIQKIRTNIRIVKGAGGIVRTEQLVYGGEELSGLLLLVTNES